MALQDRTKTLILGALGDEESKNDLVSAVNSGTNAVQTNGSIPFTGNQSLGGFKLTNSADPVSNQDLATKAYVDSQAGGGSTTWTKYTLSQTSFSAVATTKDVSLFSLLAKQSILQLVIKTSAAFTGGSISDYTFNVGISGPNFFEFINSYDAFPASSGTNFSIYYPGVSNGLVDFLNPTDIRIQATSSGANLNAATTGSVDVWVLTTTLP